MLVKHSNTSNILRFTLKNSSTGIGLTGLTSASAGLIIATICNNEATTTTYTQAAGNIETISAALGTYAAPTASKCRFKEVDATNHKGFYEFQIADARFAIASARSMAISVTGATNLLDADYEIQLVSFDPHDSVFSTHNAAAVKTAIEAAGSHLALIKAQTDLVTAARMGALTDWINGGRLDLILDIIAANTTTDIPALIAALNDLSAANVNAEVADVLKTDTKGEPAQGAPGATLSIEDKIAFIYKFLRNKIWTTSTGIEIYNDAGDAVDHKSTISDDGTTFKRSEFESGP